MSCPICGCARCQGTACCPVVLVDGGPHIAGMIGRFGQHLFGERLERFSVADVAEPAAMMELIEPVLRKSATLDGGRPFHQRLNRKPWER